MDLLTVLKTLRFCVLTVEELENPRPHYRVAVRGSVTAMPGSCDHTAGLLPEEVVMTVRLPTDVGTDMTIIKEAACQRAVALLDTLVKAHIDKADTALQPASSQTEAADIDA